MLTNSLKIFLLSLFNPFIVSDTFSILTYLLYRNAPQLMSKKFLLVDKFIFDRRNFKLR